MVGLSNLLFGVCGLLLLLFGLVQWRRSSASKLQLRTVTEEREAFRNERDKLRDDCATLRDECARLRKECESLVVDPRLPSDDRLVDYLGRIAKQVLRKADIVQFAGVRSSAPPSEIAALSNRSQVLVEQPRLARLRVASSEAEGRLAFALSVRVNVRTTPPVIPHGIYRVGTNVVVQYDGHIGHLDEFSYWEASYEPRYQSLPPKEQYDEGNKLTPRASDGDRLPAPDKDELLRKLEVARQRVQKSWADVAIEKHSMERRAREGWRDEPYPLAADLSVMEKRLRLRQAELHALEEFLKDIGALD